MSKRPGRDLSTGGKSSEARRRRSISRSFERKVETGVEGQGTLRMSLSGHFTASEDFSESDDETPKVDHSEAKLKSAMKYRTPSDDSRRQIKFRTTTKNPEKRPAKNTPKHPEDSNKNKIRRNQDRSRSGSRRRVERLGQPPRRDSPGGSSDDDGDNGGRDGRCRGPPRRREDSHRRTRRSRSPSSSGGSDVDGSSELVLKDRRRQIRPRTYDGTTSFETFWAHFECCSWRHLG